jgi:hypothetical protein
VNVKGRIILPRKTGGIPRKSWSLTNTALLTGSIPFIKKLR